MWPVDRGIYEELDAQTNPTLRKQPFMANVSFPYGLSPLWLGLTELFNRKPRITLAHAWLGHLLATFRIARSWWWWHHEIKTWTRTLVRVEWVWWCILKILNKPQHEPLDVVIDKNACWVSLVRQFAYSYIINTLSLLGGVVFEFVLFFEPSGLRL